MSSLTNLPRLIFLAEEHRPPFPRELFTLLGTHGKLVYDISTKGLVAACANSDLPIETVQKFYDQGRKSPGAEGPSRGDVNEFRYLVGQMATAALELDREGMDLETYLTRMSEIRDFVMYGGDELVGTDDVSLAEDPDGDAVPKFRSGFEPFDRLTGGFYQGIVTVMGAPGHGKTTLMLAMLEALRTSGIAKSSIFLEVEIPRNVMQWKTQPMRSRTTFTEKDRLLTGSYTTRQVLRMILEDPDPDRAVFIDGPDAMTAASGDKKRFAIEAVYRDLLRIKNLSKIVVVSSQPRRGDEILGLESVAEGWSKAWYSDVVLGIHRQSQVFGEGVYRVMANCSKNRFGQVGGQVSFDFDYTTIQPRTIHPGANDNWDFDLGDGSGKKLASIFED
jgi:hypothetical protein